MSDRLEQIKRTAHRVTPIDVGVWKTTRVNGAADGVVIAPTDLAWLLAVARDTIEEDPSHEWGTENYRRFAVLFNDITHSPVQRFIHLTDRRKIAEYLWSQGWRRNVQPEDVTEK